MEDFRIENLSFKYPKSDEYALSDIKLCVKSGEFLLVIGESGSGKTTLLRMLKNELRPHGEMSGEILFRGNNIASLDERESAKRIGFIMQDPDSQIVSDRVYSEISFGLENLGLEKEVIRARVAEFASYFGLNAEFERKTVTLSGGQKQLLNLASVMAMEPDVIVLDEPTSQLDPIAAVEFLDALKRLNDDFGVTIIIAEHHLENIYKYADRVLCMENGSVRLCDSPREVVRKLEDCKIAYTLPVSARLYRELNDKLNPPLTIKEGRELIRKFKNDYYISQKELKNENIAFSCREVWFRYEKNSADILKGFSLKVYRGEFYSVVGENGCGKSTLLKLLNGSVKQYRGRVKQEFAAVAYLPQNPKNLFVKDTLEDDFKSVDISYIELCRRFNLQNLLNRHPYDLSGGELERAALCKLLLTKPEVLLLDEPTKGLDAFKKQELGKLLRELSGEGITIVCVTHDLDFAAEFADRCGLLFDGEITSENFTNAFFTNNSFYTTSSAKLSKGVFRNAVTYGDLLECVKAVDRR